MDWSNKTVLITGASAGLGKATALELARRGANLLMVARRAEVLDAAAHEVARSGARVHTIAADVADKEATFTIAARAALHGPIDVLVHNASTLGPVPLADCLDTTCEDLQRALEVNLVGPFRLSKALGGAMLLRGRGLIVQISSDAATAVYPGWGAYGASKAALEQLGRIWDAELRGSGVRVLSFDPGEMDTAMHADAMPDVDPSTLATPSAAAERLIAWIESQWVDLARAAQRPEAS
jgi:short-subunit dehydrogenase